MSKIEVDQIDPQSGTNLTIGTSGDTIKTGTGTSLVVQGDGSSANGLITLNCSQNSHGVKLSSPDHSGGQSYTMKLPATNITAGKFLKVDSITGSGATAVGQLSFADAGGGKVNQVIQTVKTDTFSSTSGSLTDITGMSAAITPTASDSKVLVMVNMSVSVTVSNRWANFQLLRGSTAISLGDASGSRTRGSFFMVLITGSGESNDIEHKTLCFLDSPSTTSATTYKMQGMVQTDSSPSFVVNRSGNDADASYGGRPASSITLMEILA